MKSEPEARRAYASLRIRGDSLDPERVTRALRVFPTVAYAKGAKYRAGDLTGELVGRTGLWLLSSRDIVASDNLLDHLNYIIGILAPGPTHFAPLAGLRVLLERHKDVHVDVACFWHGRVGDKRPSIPRSVTEFLKMIPAEIELDFATDSPELARRPA